MGSATRWLSRPYSFMMQAIQSPSLRPLDVPLKAGSVMLTPSAQRTSARPLEAGEGAEEGDAPRSVCNHTSSSLLLASNIAFRPCQLSEHAECSVFYQFLPHRNCHSRAMTRIRRFFVEGNQQFLNPNFLPFIKPLPDSICCSYRHQDPFYAATRFAPQDTHHLHDWPQNKLGRET